MAAQSYHGGYEGPPGENRYGYDQRGVAVDPEELKRRGMGAPPPPGYHAGYQGPPGENRFGYDRRGVAIDPEEMARKGMPPPPPPGYYNQYEGPTRENQCGYDAQGAAKDPEEMARKGMAPPPPPGYHNQYSGAAGENRYCHDQGGVALDPEEMARRGMPPPAHAGYHKGYEGPPGENRRGYDAHGVALDPEEMARKGMPPPPPPGYHKQYEGPAGENRYGYDARGVAQDPEEMARKGMPPPSPPGYHNQYQGAPGKNAYGYDQGGVSVDPEELAWKNGKLIPQKPKRNMHRTFGEMYGPSRNLDPKQSVQPSPQAGSRSEGVRWQDAQPQQSPIGRPVDSLKQFVQNRYGPAAIQIPGGGAGGEEAKPAAGGYSRQHKNDIPRMARPIGAGIGNLANSPGGLGGEKPESNRAHYSPAGAFRNQDALSQGEAGITGAHNKKDGLMPFEGMYGRAHAGKSQLSQIGWGESAEGRQPDSLEQFQQHQRAAAAVSGVAAAMGGHTEADSRAGDARGVRMFPEAKGRDNLLHNTGGMSTKEGVEREYKSMRGQHGIGIRGRGSSITTMAQGIGANSETYGADQRPPVHRSYANRQPSVLVNRDGGMVEQGEAKRALGPHAGKSQASHLHFGEGGMGMAGGGVTPIGRHAGRITESSIMQQTSGISIPGKDAQRQNSHGNPNWATTHDDAYQSKPHAVNYGQVPGLEHLAVRY